MTALDLDRLRQWIGRVEETTDTVSPRLVKGLAATLDRSGDAVPPAIHWCLAPAIAPESELGPDGHPARGGFLPPVMKLPRRMWAGGVVDFADPLRLGDAVTRRSRIADVQVKEGRSGTLCFVTVEHEYRTERGRALTERQDIVYREADSPMSPDGAPETRPTPKWRRTLTADAVMLFRYSALTFNGHRIHYDRDYCREVEHYPGLVVHGPLQATLLVEHAIAARGGSVPRQFAFRAVRPLFDGAGFSLNAVEEDGGLILWTADGRGRATMTATARW